MRLVCPNCEAKYEVPEDAIPETGRDVQCANCGHAWFQMRPRAAGSETAVPTPAAANETPIAPAPQAAAPAPVEPAPLEQAPPEAQEAVAEAPAPGAASAPDAVETAPEAVEPAAPDPEPQPEPMPAPVADEAASGSDAPSPVEIATAEVTAEPEAPVAETPPTDAVDEQAVMAAPTAEPDVAAEVQAETEAAPTDDDVTSTPPAATAAAAAYAVDESVLAILREEADRERKARQADASKPVETQTDLGVDQAIPHAAKLRDVANDDLGSAGRRTRLPDVEEINSTLRPSEVAVDDLPPEAMPVEVEGRSSFRSGFLLVLTVAILGSAIYASADAIAEWVPALAGPLKSYVSFVDSLRLQLDGLMQSATVAINGN